MKIVFRVDASTLIGTGHVMRCLSLANALQSRDNQISFICRELPGNLIQKIQKNRFKVFILPYLQHKINLKENVDQLTWLGEEIHVELKQSISIISNINPDIVIIDHYSLDILWESCIRPFCKKIMVIDDLANRQHDCDILLDQNLQKEKNRYKDLVPVNCDLLLGTNYALLRKEFLEWREIAFKKNRMQLQKILVFLGGMPLEKIIQKILQGILGSEFNGVVDVVLGKNDVSNNSLKKKFSENTSVRFYTDIDNMAELMCQADLCIGAAGSSSWERCYLGLPSLVTVVAENQIMSAEQLSLQKAVINCGGADTLSVELISSKINWLLQYPEVLLNLSEMASRLVDGLGVERVLSSLLHTKKHDSLILRRATIHDAMSIFEIRNHPNVRMYFFNQSEVDFEKHKDWIFNSLNNKNRDILVGENGTSEIIGVIRFDYDDNCAEVDIYVDPKFHGMGYGSALLKQGMRWVIAERKPMRFVSRVLSENIASQRVFLNQGFLENHSYFVKEVMSDE